MQGMTKKQPPERDQTDESLRKERRNTDQVIAERRSNVEQNADVLVERARENADAVLETAREKADAKVIAGPAVVKARALEDEVLEDERAIADESLRKERAEAAKMLAKLLPLEREKTDRFLLTERARSDDKLANRDDFMGMVSHDLRNLLSGIVMNASELSELATKSAEGTRTVAGMQRIQRYAARMNRLIGDLVDVVSIDAGKLCVQPTRCDAAVLVAEAVDAFAQLAAEKKITLHSQLGSGPLMATFDHARMLQVLANFITNALKFTPRGGTILVHGESSAKELLLTVTDSGAGIAPGMLDTVFERFWQVNKNDQRGLGLGLYISRCIVRAHDGAIWATSTPGKGSVFHVTLPIGATTTAG
jgi:signal transduction histidine kinase